MYNPFSLIISKLFGGKEKVPELTVEELSDIQGAVPHLIKELESVRNKETIRNDAPSQRTKRRRKDVRRNSNNNS